jgi:hypothetical protein
MPELLANANNQNYIKSDNEDFNSVLNGITGQKKRIHMHACDVIDLELDTILSTLDNQNKQIQALAQIIDDAILSSFKLWPTNYIAYDIMHNTTKYISKYTKEQKLEFITRMNGRVNDNDAIAMQLFLGMYANPVANQSKYHNEY